MLRPEIAELQRQLIDGWARRGVEIDAGARGDRSQAWRARRLAHVAAGRSRIVVGHRDVIGWPSRHVRRRPSGSVGRHDGRESDLIDRCRVRVPGQITRCGGSILLVVASARAARSRTARRAPMRKTRYRGRWQSLSAIARRQADRRPPVADDQRRDRHLQSIEQVRLEKHRHGDAAALDEDPVAAARAQQRAGPR